MYSKDIWWPRVRTTQAFAIAAAVLLTIFTGSITGNAGSSSRNPSSADSGSLQIIDSRGAVTQECPLKHTDVRAAISGPVARVTVTQAFVNPSQQNIEAVYVFPLPQHAAVDEMTMKVGERTIRGVIKQRDEARKIYENAKQQGHVASLLDQERPNIFTQSVANIAPGASVTITISYVEVLKYDDGNYEFVFPMVVGPRYIPGQPTDRTAGGWASNTTKVPDASKITPPVALPGTRAGHDISVEVALDAGVPIQEIRSELHKVVIDRTGATSARVELAEQNTIPNKDFILRYDVAGARIADAVLTHRSGKGDGYFALLLQPPERFPESDVTPKELVFVLDTSGSMSGFPIEKGKELVNRALAGLNSRDTFNLITFSGDTAVLFPEPVYPSASNLASAREFLASRRGGGGTEMMKAIRAALNPSDAQDHLRIVVFITDGYVGNDMEILGEVQKHPNARVFSFGVGQSVNRFLLDGMARESRGEVEYVSLAADGDAAVNRLYQRLRSPLLTDVSIDTSGLPVAEIFPSRIPDLFAAKPIVVYGRYSHAAKGAITLKGKRAGEPWSRTIQVDLPEREAAHDVLGSLWAREKIEMLMAQDWKGLQRGFTAPEIEKQITRLGLEHRLMTQFTSFVAVEERTTVSGGTPVTVQVPVEMPEGVRYEGVFGGLTAEAKTNFQIVPSMRLMSRVDAAKVSGYAISGAVPAGSPPPPANLPDAFARKEKPTLLELKLDPKVLNAYTCATAKPAKVNCASYLRIEVLFMGKTDAQRLKAAGFTLKKTLKSHQLVGAIAVKDLPKLAALEFVQFIKLAS